jgi:predicted nucleic acid-binding protein
VADGPPQAALGGLPSTSVFIYQLEANPRCVGLTDHIFAWLERADHRAVISTITTTELLVQPYRDKAEHRVDEFHALLSTYSNLNWIAPDALQAATAIRAQATGLVTNDPVFQRVGAIETLLLDHLL